MEACSGQNHDNKTAPQVNFTPTAASIMDLLCIFVITRQYFFSMLVILTCGTPNQCSHDSLVFKKYSSFTYSKGWTVCWSITNEGYAHTNLGTCNLFPVAMMSFTSVASILLKTLINTWTSASPSSRQSAWKKKYDRRLCKATW